MNAAKPSKWLTFHPAIIAPKAVTLSIQDRKVLFSAQEKTYGPAQTAKKKAEKPPTVMTASF